MEENKWDTTEGKSKVKAITKLDTKRRQSVLLENGVRLNFNTTDIIDLYNLFDGNPIGKTIKYITRQENFLVKCDPCNNPED